MFLFSEGRRHDSGILADSQLLPLLNRHAFLPGGQLMCIYGDPAYPLWAHQIQPFRQGSDPSDARIQYVYEQS